MILKHFEATFHHRMEPVSCIEMCNIWMQAHFMRVNRTKEEHDDVRSFLVNQLKKKGIHTLTVYQKMDIAYYCVFGDTSTYNIYETNSFKTSSFRKLSVEAFKYQSAIFRQKLTPFSWSLSNGINFLTPHVHPNLKQTMKTDIRLLFKALNSHVELIPKPINLLDIGFDCLNIIGEMVKRNNIEEFKIRHYISCKEENFFITYWEVEEVTEKCIKLSEEHPYILPIIIRNYSVDLGFKSEVVVIRDTWLDIWHACDSVIRNSKNKEGVNDNRICIKGLAQPGKYFRKFKVHMSDFLDEDDDEYDEYYIDGEYDPKIWYLIANEM